MGLRTIGFGVRRIWVRDRGRRIGATIWVCDRGSRSGFARGSRSGFAKSNGEIERIRSQTANRSSPLFSSSLSLSLSLRAGASSSPSALSLFSEKFLFEGKIETEINLHPFKGQLKSISGKCIFRAQPNTRKKVKSIFGNAFHPKQTQLKEAHDNLRFQTFGYRIIINQCSPETLKIEFQSKPTLLIIFMLKCMFHTFKV